MLLLVTDWEVDSEYIIFSSYPSGRTPGEDRNKLNQKRKKILGVISLSHAHEHFTIFKKGEKERQEKSRNYLGKGHCGRITVGDFQWSREIAEKFLLESEKGKW